MSEDRTSDPIISLWNAGIFEPKMVLSYETSGDGADLAGYVLVYIVRKTLAALNV